MPEEKSCIRQETSLALGSSSRLNIQPVLARLILETLSRPRLVGIECCFAWFEQAFLPSTSGESIRYAGDPTSVSPAKLGGDTQLSEQILLFATGPFIELPRPDSGACLSQSQLPAALLLLFAFASRRVSPTRARFCRTAVETVRPAQQLVSTDFVVLASSIEGGLQEQLQAHAVSTGRAAQPGGRGGSVVRRKRRINLPATRCSPQNLPSYSKMRWTGKIRGPCRGHKKKKNKGA